MLVEYDSFFEWFKETAMELLNDILSEIDKSLSSVGCGYLVTTKH